MGVLQESCNVFVCRFPYPTGLYLSFKDTLSVLRRDELLVQVSVDILLITKHILDHVISLES